VNENIIDVLIYIYETYMDGEKQLPSDQILIEEHLLKIGFHEGEINKAFDWLDELAWRQGALQENGDFNQASMRLYSDEEVQRIDMESRGLLLFLEQNGILDPLSRELVIERAMALENPELDSDDIQWIALLVLLNQPGQETAFSLMENLVYDGIPDLLH
jgi:Smg protein